MALNRMRVGPELERRVRDYAVQEPSFTIAFAAWELGVSSSAVGSAIQPLLERGVIEEIEPRNGPYGAVYSYREIAGGAGGRARLFAELDDARIGELAPARGQVVPHTRAKGPSHSPGRDKKRQARGVRVKRQRNGT